SSGPSPWIFAQPYAGPEAGAVAAQRLALLERSRRWLGDSLAGAALNDMYCSNVILEDGALEGGLTGENLASWAQLWRTHPAARTAPLLMTRALWRFWLRLGYQENPL